MTLLQAIRDRMHPPDSAGDPPDPDSQALTDRFDRLNEREAASGLTPFDQAELTAIEAFERSHRGRPAVLSKLRYLRQPEPVPGYDALEAHAIGDALSGADTETIKAAREYENKLKKRPTVLIAINRALRASRGQPMTSARAPDADGEQPPVVGNGLPVRAKPGS